jgi:hypothetical protein
VPAHDEIERPVTQQRAKNCRNVSPDSADALRPVLKSNRQGSERLGNVTGKCNDLRYRRVRAEGAKEVAIELRDPAAPAMTVRQ